MLETKSLQLLINGSLRNFRHSFGEGHLDFATPKRRGHEEHEDLEYSRQASGSTQTTDGMCREGGSKKSKGEKGQKWYKKGSHI